MKEIAVPIKNKQITKNGLINSVSGTIAGGVVSVALCPLDVIRMRIMIERKAHVKSGLFHTGFSIVRSEGIKSLYKGLGTTMIGLVPNWGIYFFCYEYAKDVLSEHEKIPFIQKNILSSVFAGALTTIATSPLWVIRTRMMTQVGEFGYRGLPHAFSEIYKTEGYRGFYHGLLPSVLGLAHVAIQFPLYESIKKWRRSQRPKSDRHLHMTDIFLASTVSKFFASVVAYPHEVLRSRLQDQGHGERTNLTKPFSLKYSGMAHAIELTYREEGWRGFYKGLGTNLVRVLPSAAITLGTFEIVSQFLRDKFL